jgi:plant G-box-binding factor
MLNQTMPMVPIQPGAMVGVPGSTANLNIGMDYWAAPGSATVPATQGKATSGSARGDQWVLSFGMYLHIYMNYIYTKILMFEDWHVSSMLV